MRAVADRWAGTLSDVLRLADPAAAGQGGARGRPAPRRRRRRASGRRGRWTRYTGGPAFLEHLAAGQCPACARGPRCPDRTGPPRSLPRRRRRCPAAAACVIVVPDARDAGSGCGALTRRDRRRDASSSSPPISARPSATGGSCASRAARSGPCVGTRAAAYAPVRGSRSGRRSGTTAPICTTSRTRRTPTCATSLVLRAHLGQRRCADRRSRAERRGRLAGGRGLGAACSRRREAVCAPPLRGSRSPAPTRSWRATGQRGRPAARAGLRGRPGGPATPGSPHWSACRGAATARPWPATTAATRRAARAAPGRSPRRAAADVLDLPLVRGGRRPTGLPGMRSPALARGRRRQHPYRRGTGPRLSRGPGRALQRRRGGRSRRPPSRRWSSRPRAPNRSRTRGYGAVLLLDAWALLGRADLRAGEEALRRWMNASAPRWPAAQRRAGRARRRGGRGGGRAGAGALGPDRLRRTEAAVARRTRLPARRPDGGARRRARRRRGARSPRPSSRPTPTCSGRCPVHRRRSSARSCGSRGPKARRWPPRCRR